MKIILGSLFFVFILELTFGSFNINLTTSNQNMADQAKLLIGTPTSIFPGESFLNFIMYGHSDVPFKYHDFISSFGFKTDYFEAGNIIIGNDGKLGAIIVEGLSAVVPIPRGKVTNIPQSSLKKYFSKGYSILYTMARFKARMLGIFTNATLNNTFMCHNSCPSIIYTVNIYENILT